MILTEQQINYIDKNLELYGLKNQTLKEDILDHICTYIENTDETNFDIAYQNAINQFGGYLNINQLQRETNAQLYFKSAKNRTKFLFIIGENGEDRRVRAQSPPFTHTAPRPDAASLVCVFFASRVGRLVDARCD